jgi:hypothetical protein
MIDPANVPPEALEFLGDYHLATLTTLLPNRSFHRCRSASPGMTSLAWPR